MTNIKSITVTNDGTLKRLSITYDVVDDSGKVVKSNMKLMRAITSNGLTNQLTDLEKYAQALINEG